MNTEHETATKPRATGETSYFDREVSWLRADPRGARWATVAVLFALVAYLGLIAKLATGPINVFHNDPMMLLDDGWRALNGQVPHRDFYSPLGPLEFCIVGGGMLLAKGSAQGLAIGIAIFGFVVGIWGWLLCRGRLPALLGLLVTSWLVITATCPSPLGYDPRFMTCAMIYNRQGYALLGIVLLECAFAREKIRFWGGVSSGAALILLAFLKLNYFGVGCLMLLATVPLTRAELPRLWGFLAGAVGTILAFFIYLRFSFAAFFSDMAYAIHAKGATVSDAGVIGAVAKCAQSGTVWMVAAATVAIIFFAGRKARWARANATLAMLSLVVLASGPLFLETNSLENRCQMASLWVIILLDRVTAEHLRRTDLKVLTLAMIAVCLGSVATDVLPDVLSAFTLMRYASTTVKASGASIAAQGMSNVRFYDSSSFYDKVKGGDGDGFFYANCLNDGLTLLSTQSRSEESILSLGFHNPFSYLLRRRPAKGGSTYLGIGNSISKTHMPTIDRVFGDADLMVLPIYDGTHRENDQFIQNYYRPYLVQNFHFIAESPCWVLYRRNK